MEVRIEGNRTISSSQVFGQLATRAGRPFDPQIVQQDIRKLYKLGWFAYIEPLYQQTPQGRIVIFRVTERPVIRYVNYLGNKKIKDKNLAEQTGLKYGETLDPYRVDRGREKIAEFYKTKGYNRVQVTAMEGLKPNDRGVTYVIHEGPQQKIWKVKFIGNDSGFVSNSRLKKLVQSKPGILWVFKGNVDRQKIDADERQLEEYYRAFGFFQADVSPVMDYDEDGDWLTLRWIIHEGPRAVVRNVVFEGNSRFATKDLKEKLQLNPGDSFEKTKLDTDRTWLADLYGSQGFVYADIQAQTRFLTTPGEVNLVYKIAEGERWRVGRILVRIGGENPHTKITTALNRLTLAPGDIVDTREIKASELRLVRSNLFHRDPSRGVSPRITFQISENQPSRLSQSQPPPTYRGQSPGQSQQPARHTTMRAPTNGGPARSQDMVLTFANLQHYKRWFGANLRSSNQPAVAAPVRVQRSAQPHAVPQPIVNPAYNQLLQPRRQPVNPLPPRQSSYRDDSNDRETPHLLVRGQSPSGWHDSVGYGYGGSTVGATGPNAQQAQPAPPATPRIAQGSPLFDPNRPVSPNSPGTLPNPAFPGQVYSVFPPGNAQQPFQDPTVDLVLDLEETQTGRFMAGVGVNSDAGVVGSIVIDERNFDWRRFPTSWADIGNAFRGDGQRFRMEAAPGSQVQRYLISWQQPYWRGTPFSVGLSGSYFDRRFQDWDEQRLGGRVSLGYQWPRRDLTATVAYRGESVNIHDPFIPTPPELAEALGDNVLHGFRLTLANDTRDSSFLATSGHYMEMSFEQVIGTFTYPRAMMDFRKYFLVRQRPDRSGRHVVSYSTRLGFTGSNTPIYEHFFAGGYSTLRGFDFRGASPVTGVVEVGGEFMWINSLEYLLPVTADDMFHVVGFVDFGTVERNVEINDFRVSPGFGLRITVPAMGPAPIALDFAWPIEFSPTDDREVFSFHIGLQRL